MERFKTARIHFYFSSIEGTCPRRFIEGLCPDDSLSKAKIRDASASIHFDCSAIKHILMSDINNLNFIFSSIKKVSRAYADFLSKELEDYDLSPNEIVVLSSLDSVSTASDIAKDSDVSKALVSRSVASLKERGLIKVSISEVDKREQKVVLTEQGERISELIDLLNEQFARKVFGNFQENEKRVLVALMKVIVANIAD